MLGRTEDTCPSCGGRTLEPSQERNPKGQVRWRCRKAGCWWKLWGQPPRPPPLGPKPVLPRTPPVPAIASPLVEAQASERTQGPINDRSDKRQEPTRPVRPVPIQHIIGAVLDALRVPGESFYGRSRHPATVLARTLVVTLARRLTILSFPELARAMNRPNHSTCVTESQRYRVWCELKVSEYCRSDFALEPDVANSRIADLVDRMAQSLTRD